MRPFIRHLLLLAIALWLWGHALLFVAEGAMSPVSTPAELLRPTVPSGLLIAGIVVAISMYALRRRNEDLLLGNLGIGLTGVAGGLGAGVLVLEASLWWVMR